MAPRNLSGIFTYVRTTYFGACNLTRASRVFFHFAVLDAFFKVQVTTARHLPILQPEPGQLACDWVDS